MTEHDFETTNSATVSPAVGQATAHSSSTSMLGGINDNDQGGNEQSHRPAHQTQSEHQTNQSTVQLTSSRKGNLYFAYGSNLSTTQMLQRCPSSSTPLAVAKLTSYAWFICDRGYANVIALPPADPMLDTEASTVWGLIYLLTSTDEAKLDTYEGFDEASSGGPNPNVSERKWKPFLQGDCSYNKLYLLVEVEKWLVDDHHSWGIAVDGNEMKPVDGAGMIKNRKPKLIRTLIYVDEVRVRPGRIMPEYVPRMSRAVMESVPLGISEKWVDTLMRQHGIVWWFGHSAGKRSGAGKGFSNLVSVDDSWEATRERWLRSGAEGH